MDTGVGMPSPKELLTGRGPPTGAGGLTQPNPILTLNDLGKGQEYNRKCTHASPAGPFPRLGFSYCMNNEVLRDRRFGVPLRRDKHAPRMVSTVVCVCVCVCFNPFP